VTVSNRLRTALSFSGPFVIFAALWQAASAWLAPDPTMFPGLGAIAYALVRLSASPELWSNLGISLARNYLGLALAIVAGVSLGSCMARYPIANGFFSPLVGATYSLPKTALIPLLLLWLGVGSTTDTTAVFLSCLLPIVVHSYHGAKDTPRVLLWSAAALGTPDRALLPRVMLPSSLPQIVTGTRIALGFSYVVTIAAEMIASKSGIGKLIFVYGGSGAYDYLFATILVIIVVAYLVDQAYVRLTATLLRWHHWE